MTCARPLPRPGWNVRVGLGCRMPFIGVGPERLVNGRIWRVSVWPMRYGFHVVIWREPERTESPS